MADRDVSWAARLAEPQPPHIEAAADALLTLTTTRDEARVIALTLDDAGLLRREPPC